ncbi:MAG: GldG family protein [Deinococcales bacterium]
MSEKTHPLLSPLRPQVADLLREYEIAGKGKVKVEVIDPIKYPELEAEASQNYGIQPQPFQVSDRSQTALVNAYFDILVRYGDQSEVLSFSDLIEIVPSASGAPDVRLRNLEYDLSRSIKKASSGFQSVESLLASLTSPAKLTILATPSTMPDSVREGYLTIQKVAQEMADASKGKLVVSEVDPFQETGAYSPQKLAESYGVQPIGISLFSNDSFYLYMLLDLQNETRVLYPLDDMSEANIKNSLEAGLKRAAPGFLKVVGIWSPPEVPTQSPFGQQIPPVYRARGIRDQLGFDYQVKEVSLNEGSVPADVDVLVVLSPKGLDDKGLYAIDQFLMRGGSVIMATSQYALALDPFSGDLTLEAIEGGVRDLLDHYGISLGDSVVMDWQNAPFPVMTNRNVGGVQVREVNAIDYPYFTYILPNAMAQGHPSTANVPDVLLPWASPVSIKSFAEGATNPNNILQQDILLKSSPKAWLSQSTNIQPNFDLYPNSGFAAGSEQQSYSLGVALRGSFESYFKDKASPLATTPEDPNASAEDSFSTEPSENVSSGVGTIPNSPDSARLVVIGSGEFVNDIVLNIASQLGQDRSLSSLQFLQNSVDWSLEDDELLSIRSRGSYTRVLKPLSDQEKWAWEFGNYVFAILALVILATLWQLSKRNQRPLFSEASQVNPQLGGQV